MNHWERPHGSLRRTNAGIALAVIFAVGFAATVLRAEPDEAGRLRVLPAEVLATNASEVWTPPPAGAWRTLPPAPVAARLDHTAVWTGREVIVWGGFDQFSRPLTDGARFDPVTGRWSPLPPTGARRPASAAVWTGTDVVLTAPDATWRYDPIAEAWTSAPPVPVPDGHILDDRVVTLDRDVIAITEPFAADAKAAVFSLAPGGAVWEPLPDLPVTLSRAHVVLSVGTTLLVFGPPVIPGQPTGVVLETRSPAPAWRPFPAPPGLDGLALRTLVGGGGGDTLVLWGARSGDGRGWTVVWDGRRWHSGRAGPLRATWSTVGLWIGRRLLVWDRSANRGAVYGPTDDRWTPLPAPELRGTGVRPVTWTGTSLVVAGSFGTSGAIVRPPLGDLHRGPRGPPGGRYGRAVGGPSG